jgi:hypothetical protein
VPGGGGPRPQRRVYYNDFLHLRDPIVPGRAPPCHPSP